MARETLLVVVFRARASSTVAITRLRYYSNRLIASSVCCSPPDRAPPRSASGRQGLGPGPSPPKAATASESRDSLHVLVCEVMDAGKAQGKEQCLRRPVLHLPVVLVGRGSHQLRRHLPQHRRQAWPGKPVPEEPDVSRGRRLRGEDVLRHDRPVARAVMTRRTQRRPPRCQCGIEESAAAQSEPGQDHYPFGPCGFDMMLLCRPTLRCCAGSTISAASRWLWPTFARW